MRYSRRDLIIAAALTVVLFALGIGLLSRGLADWGDDHSAYINEGIAIAQGRLDEQAKLNVRMHPSQLPDEALRSGELHYVWGYPLLLSGVYHLVGFDRVNYSSVIWYKLPSLGCLALMAGVMYLFYRRRFGWKLSLGLTLFFYQSGAFFRFINRCYSDVVFMFVSMLMLLLAEIYLTRLDRPLRCAVIAVALAMTMWYAREVRLNGLATCGVVLLGHVVSVVKGRAKLTRRNAWLHILPYALAVALAIGSESLWLGRPTPNLSDITRFDFGTMITNISWYITDAMLMFDGAGQVYVYVMALAMTVLIAIGITRRGREGEGWLKLLTLASYVIVVVLPYYQGPRYLFNVMPLMLMYAADGLIWLIPRIRSRLKDPRRAARLSGDLRKALWGMAALAYGIMIVQSVLGNLDRDRATTWKDVYTDDAVAVYRYIQDNTPEDAVIAFRKPRALFLNTGRVSVCPGLNGHSLDEADYFLYDSQRYGTNDDSEAEAPERLELLYDNAQFQFYRVID